ncbi:hypothetical protein L1987_28655 [Smallanthus sonchifolius]|uniref:Uncharacterized protein n=1 Tax=Smallanthus sonchifolius TaxID=185202 RepID=A0ACB9HXQ2_9ASTR|nr:hypothetical protein L1987_28655 [Smallanthus sonchifolius]
MGSLAPSMPNTNGHQPKDRCGYFEMPLHYPRYTRTEYESMPESVIYGEWRIGDDLKVSAMNRLGSFESIIRGYMNRNRDRSIPYEVVKSGYDDREVLAVTETQMADVGVEGSGSKTCGFDGDGREGAYEVVCILW